MPCVSLFGQEMHCATVVPPTNDVNFPLRLEHPKSAKISWNSPPPPTAIWCYDTALRFDLRPRIFMSTKKNGTRQVLAIFCTERLNICRPPLKRHDHTAASSEIYPLSQDALAATLPGSGIASDSFQAARMEHTDIADRANETVICKRGS